jgi:error-prone DNA polymerase
MKIIKVDLLGLGMLAVLKDTAYLVPQYYGVPLDYAQLPQDDAVYATIQAGDTIGLFQIESPAQIATVVRTRPKCFRDLSDEVAIVRPGPVTGKFVNPYIERKLGRQPITYLHESFKPFLERTYGVPLYQEQVMKTGMVAANLTGGEAEELRKAMGGKRSEAILTGMTARLRGGMTANGFDVKTQDEVLEVLSTVREFMFPESHAYSFASLAYSSAYTRHYYPAAYTCALFNNQPMGFYSPETLLNDAKRHRVKVLAVDVQQSEWFCTLEELEEKDHDKYVGPFALRIGLRYVRGLREKIGQAIVEARFTGGPFASEYDLKRRAPSIRRRNCRCWPRPGFSTGPERSIIAEPHSGVWERAGQSPGPLFESVPDEQEMERLTPLRAMTTEERLVADFESTGLTVGPQLMAYHRAEMNTYGVIPAARLGDLPDGVYTRIAGVVIVRQQPGTAGGFIFLSLEDETGVSRAIVNPHVYERNRVALTRGKILRLDGTLQN